MQIAGAAAAEGLSLKEVAAVANDTAKQCRSVGVATRICTLPGAAPSDRSTVQVPLHSCFFSLGFVKWCCSCTLRHLPKLTNPLLYKRCVIMLLMHG